MDQDYFEFKLHLQGKALEGRTIDAKELGVALIGINDSLDIIAKQMPGARQKQTSLQIQASLEKGSVIALLKFVFEAVASNPALFSETVSLAKETFECFILLINLRKTFGDQEVTSAQVDTVANQTQYINCTINNFNGNVKQLSQKIHNGGVLAKPLKEAFSPLGLGNHAERCELLDANNAKVLDIDRQGYELMTTPAQSAAPQALPPMKHVDAVILGVRFDEKKWTIKSNGTEYAAKLTDMDFHARVQNREVSFSAGDHIDIDLNQTMVMRNGKPSIEYEIAKVYSTTRDQGLFRGQEL